MSTVIKNMIFLAVVLTINLSANADVRFEQAVITHAGESDAVITVSGETSSSLVKLLNEVNVFRDHNGFQLLFFATIDSGIGLPVIEPFNRKISVDSLDDGAYSIRCFALNANMIDSTFFFSPDSSTFILPGDSSSLPDSLFILADTTFIVTYTRTVVTKQSKAPGIFDVQAYPNPFNAQTTLKFSVPSHAFVRLGIYDIRGRKVATLTSETLAAGDYAYTWDASDLPSGIYFYELWIGDKSNRGRISLLR